LISVFDNKSFAIYILTFDKYSNKVIGYI